MQKLNLVDQSVTLDLNNFSQGNIALYATHFFFGEVSDNGTNYTLNVYHYDNDWTNKTCVYTVDSGIVKADYTAVKPYILNQGSGNFIIVFGFSNNATATTNWIQYIYCDTDPTNVAYWHHALNPFPTTGCGGRINAIQYQWWTGDSHIILHFTDGYIQPLGDNLNTLHSKESVGGYTSKGFNGWAGDFYYLVYDGANYLIRKMNPTSASFSTVETISGMTGYADLEFSTAQLWVKWTNPVATFIVCWKNNLWYKENATIGWKQFIGLSSNYPTYSLNSNSFIDNSIIKYFGFSTSILSLSPKNPLVLLTCSSSHSYYCAIDEWFIDTDKKVWKLEPADISSAGTCTACTIKTAVASPMTGVYQTTSEPDENEYVKLYTDADVLIFQGWLRNAQHLGEGAWTCEMKSPVIDDLKTTILEDYAAHTETDIIKHILDDYCYWLTYDATSIDGSATAIATFKCNGLTVREALNKLAVQDSRDWYIEPDFILHFNTNAIDSTVNVIQGTDPCEMNEPPKKFNIKVSYAIAYGGFDSSGERLFSEYFGEAGYNMAKLWAPQCSTQGELDTWLQNFVTKQNVTINCYNIQTAGKGMIQAGTQIDFAWADSPWLVSSAKHYVKSVTYDALGDAIDEMGLYDLFYFSTGQDETSNLECLVTQALDTAVSVSVSDTAYAGSWDTVTTIAPSKNAVYDRVQAISVQGTAPIRVGGDHNAHILNANHAIALENDNGEDITAIQKVLTNTHTQLPTSAAVVAYASPLTPVAPIPVGAAGAGDGKFLNNWVNYGGIFEAASYWKDHEGIVHLQGLVKDGTVNTAMFTLPVGYRPSARLILTTSKNGAAFTVLDVYSDGTVIIAAGSSTWQSLSGLSFYVG